MTATVMVMKIVTKRWLWTIRPWTADATAAGFTLSHPTTQRVATTIIAIDLIDRQDWPPAGKIADHSRLKSVITVVPCLADGRSGNAESESCRDEKDDFFHCIELAVQNPSDAGLWRLFNTIETFLRKTRDLCRNRGAKD